VPPGASLPLAATLDGPSFIMSRGVVLGAATGLAITGLVLTVPAPVALAGAVGLLGLVAIVRYPFLGLYLIVLGSQLGGLIESALRGFEDIFLEGVALATFAGIALNACREPRGRRFGPDLPAFRLAVLYGFVLCLSYLVADNGPGAEKDVVKRMMLIVLFYLIVRLVHTKGQLTRLVVAVALATAISGSVSLLGQVSGRQLLANDARSVEEGGVGRQVGASSSNATTTSQMMLAGAGIALVLAIRDARRRRVLVVLALAGIVGIVLANTRSSFLIGLFGLGWLLFKQRRHRRLPAILILSFLMGCMALPLVPARQAERFSTLFTPDEDYTLGRRLGYQLIGFDLLMKYPILGVGAGNFRHHYMSHEYRFMPSRTLAERELHNMYLSVTVQSGLLGFACFGGMLAVSLSGLTRVMRESSDQEAVVCAEALQFGYVLFLIACVVAPATTNKLTWILTGLAAVAPRVLLEGGRTEPNPGEGGTLSAALAPLVG